MTGNPEALISWARWGDSAKVTRPRRRSVGTGTQAGRLPEPALAAGLPLESQMLLGPLGSTHFEEGASLLSKHVKNTFRR